MVVRIAGLAYQQGFGGHFHNDNAVAALRDIPGLIVACPARPDDAAALLRTCIASASEDGSVCVFLEPIALYHERDLHEPGDGGWLAPYQPPAEWASGHAPVGSGRVHGDGADLTIVTFGNGLRTQPAGRREPRRRRHQVPGARPALAGPAPARRPDQGGNRDGCRAGGGRDQAVRRRL